MVIGQCPCSQSSLGVLDVVVLMGVTVTIMLIVQRVNKKKEPHPEDKNEPRG